MHPVPENNLLLDGLNDPGNPLLEHQRTLEELYDKNQTLTRIRREFIDYDDGAILDLMKKEEINPEFGIDMLTQMVLHKRTTLPTLVGILRRHFEAKGKEDASQLAANELFKCADADLVDWSPIAKQFILTVDVSQDVKDDLERYQYPLPMVVRPRHITANTETGYLRGRGSVILKKNHTEDDVCLDHLNRVNGIRFCLDHDTAHMIANEWRNLDKPKPGETSQDFEKRKRAFEKYDRSVKNVMGLLLFHGNEFYLTHKYDKRGRTYCQGYHVNYQGSPWNKAVIELSDKELVE